MPAIPPTPSEPRPPGDDADSSARAGALAEAGGELDPPTALGPVMSPAVKDALPAGTAEQILDALSTGDVTCTVCDALITPAELRPSVLALVTSDGRTRVRFAHERCAESRLICVDRLPLAPSGQTSPGELRLTWVLAGRPRRAPTVILVCDAQRLEQLDVRGPTLVAALRLDGWRGGQPLEDIEPPRCDDVVVVRADEMIWLHTRFGDQPLMLADTEPSSSLLQVAGRQGELLVVLGVDLDLGPGTLDEVDRRLERGDVIAARVPYEDTRPAARTQRGRGLALLRVIGGRPRDAG